MVVIICWILNWRPDVYKRQVYHNDGDTLYVMDQMSDDKENDSLWLDNISLNEAMDKLADREKKILMLRFFEGKTQMEVSDEVGKMCIRDSYNNGRSRRNGKGADLSRRI